MASYCSITDILKVRPNISGYDATPATNFADQIAEADRQIDRALDYGWYRKELENRTLEYQGVVIEYWQANPFLRARLKNAATQLTTLGVYKSLQLIYLYLAKDSSEDAFTEEAGRYESLYKGELAEVLRAGLDYDFSGDNVIDLGEKSLERAPRTLERC